MQSIDDRIEILLSEIEKNNNRFKEIIDENELLLKSLVKTRKASFDDVVLEEDKIKVINVDTNEEKIVLATSKTQYGCFIGQKIGTLKIINSINYQLVDIEIDKRLVK